MKLYTNAPVAPTARQLLARLNALGHEGAIIPCRDDSIVAYATTTQSLHETQLILSWRNGRYEENFGCHHHHHIDTWRLYENGLNAGMDRPELQRQIDAVRDYVTARQTEIDALANNWAQQEVAA